MHKRMTKLKLAKETIRNLDAHLLPSGAGIVASYSCACTRNSIIICPDTSTCTPDTTGCNPSWSDCYTCATCGTCPY